MFNSFGLFNFLRNNLFLFMDDIINPFVTHGSCLISFFSHFESLERKCLFRVNIDKLFVCYVPYVRGSVRFAVKS